MAYVRTGGMSTSSRRRRRTTALVLTGLTIVLLMVLAYAVAYFQGWVGGEGDGSTNESPVTATSGALFLKPSNVTVNVYNAKGEPGLAGRIAGELRDLDFVVDDVDNDPEKAQIDHTADIRFGPDGADAAEFLQQRVPGSELVPLEREGGAVDLVLGDDFEDLAEPDGDQATATS